MAFAVSTLGSLLFGCRAILGIHDYDSAEDGEGGAGDSAPIGDAPPDDDVPRLPDGAPVPCLDSGTPGYLSNATEVAVGNGFACALLTDGTVACWGSNENGVFGTSKLGSSSAPVRVSEVSDPDGLVRIAVGDSHVCALGGSGRIYCWGGDKFGQTADASIAGHFEITPPGTSYSMISAAGSHTCVVDLHGRVSCWGSNAHGELGSTATGGPGPVPVLSPTSLGNFVAVDASLAGGTEHHCALASDASVVCWGSDSDGQLANGIVDASSTLPTFAFGGISAPTALRAGGRATCALTGSGLFCAGNGANGALGPGAFGGAPEAVAFPGVPSPIDIALADMQSCVWNADRQLFCFGLVADGALGTGADAGGAVVGIDGGTSFGPVLRVATWSPLYDPVGSGRSTGDPETCAIVDEGCGSAGAVYCWGSNSTGQIGSGADGGKFYSPQAVRAVQ